MDSVTTGVRTSAPTGRIANRLIGCPIQPVRTPVTNSSHRSRTDEGRRPAGVWGRDSSVSSVAVGVNAAPVVTHFSVVTTAPVVVTAPGGTGTSVTVPAPVGGDAAAAVVSPAAVVQGTVAAADSRDDGDQPLTPMEGFHWVLSRIRVLDDLEPPTPQASWILSPAVDEYVCYTCNIDGLRASEIQDDAEPCG